MCRNGTSGGKYEYNNTRKIIELSDQEYQAFSSKLLLGTSNIMGVRLLDTRKIAKQIAKEDWRTYLTEASNDSYEEIMLQGMVIGYAKADIEEIINYIETFVPKIKNWSVCDSFCCGLKITSKHTNYAFSLRKMSIN